MKSTFVILIATLCSLPALATEYVGEKNRFGHLTCKTSSGQEVSSDNCINKTKYVARKDFGTFNCFEKALVSNGNTMEWMYVDFVSRDRSHCLKEALVRHVGYDTDGRFRCIKQALMTSVEQDGSEVPKWMWVDAIDRDQNLCSGERRFIGRINNGMLQTCQEQAVVMMEKDQAKWLFVDYAGRSSEKCILNEKFVAQSGKCYKNVEVRLEDNKSEWTKLNYLTYDMSNCSK